MSYSSHLRTLERKLIDAKVDYEVLLDWDASPRELEVAQGYIASLEGQVTTMTKLIEAVGDVYE